ncbi:SpoIID/LytB domain-containing protein [Paenibacillus sp. J5C_2022]|uniref:SpoIID/LytB domain-containing protein n=1 Tax=Paenibacillus sp. J5C2022 TaxID=2977129 RepID=UPI0021D29445|nr:SpoIID/LytB domain-containing protein [Paenibacillus sp. J5C2022]MCU6711117.1 SpoIID/LytB domain-containing protein [Paenibacillus sp. J5C2022]
MTSGKTVRIYLITLCAMLWTAAIGAQPSYAAVPKMDTIRVAMYISLPGKYQSTTPAATFSSQGGIVVSLQREGGNSPWFQVEPTEKARFALDDYGVKLLETGDLAVAQQAHTHISASGGASSIISLSKKGREVYQLREGGYASEGEAAAARKRWESDTLLKAMTGGFKAELLGPHYLQSQPLKTRAEAEGAALAYGKTGVDAYVGMKAGEDGSPHYFVAVGQAPSPSALKAVGAAASAAAGTVALKAMSQDEPYLIMQRDHTRSGGGNAADSRYLVPAGGTKVWLSPAGEAHIRLEERSNRTYRGQFEVSGFQNKLAVVNELPLEQYLYSVVAVEMYPSWPLEALKAQAVAARSFAVRGGTGFQIAHVVDTTLSQAYYGTEKEHPSTTKAVDETKGEVALHNGSIIEALYSANSGGMTSDAAEVWGNSIPYLQPVASPDDSAEAGLLDWYHVVLPDGKLGYVREDLVEDTGQTTAAGSALLKVKTDGTNIRVHPVIQSSVPVVAQANQGTRLIALGKVKESNPMNWMRGPFTGEQLQTSLNARLSDKLTEPVHSLEVSARGPSGRATAIAVNGEELPLKSPDSIRSMLGVGESLPSTKLDVTEIGNAVILGGGGQRSSAASHDGLHILGADHQGSVHDDSHLFIMDSEGDIAASPMERSFLFTGQGNGHGVGMSQYGALSLAQQGYDYQYILQYYYKGITITKE